MMWLLMTFTVVGGGGFFSAAHYQGVVVDKFKTEQQCMTARQISAKEFAGTAFASNHVFYCKEQSNDK